MLLTGKDLPNDTPIADVAKLPLQIFLPSVDHIREFGVLIAREKMEYFPLKTVVPDHIQHKYSDVMMLKSEMVSSLLGHFIFFTTCTKCARPLII